MNASISRRRFLRSRAVGAASFVGALQMLQTRQAEAHSRPRSCNCYGPIAPVYDLTTGLPLLQLPTGLPATARFPGAAISCANSHPTSSAHDGMAVMGCGPRGIQLIRNHELGARVPSSMRPACTTRRSSTDGSTTAPLAGAPPRCIWLRSAYWLEHAEPSLGGTHRQLRRRTLRPGVAGSVAKRSRSTLSPLAVIRHGYVFEVRPAGGARPAVSRSSIWAVSRHEAVAIDPRNQYRLPDRRLPQSNPASIASFRSDLLPLPPWLRSSMAAVCRSHACRVSPNADLLTRRDRYSLPDRMGRHCRSRCGHRSCSPTSDISAGETLSGPFAAGAGHRVRCA